MLKQLTLSTLALLTSISLSATQGNSEKNFQSDKTENFFVFNDESKDNLASNELENSPNFFNEDENKIVYNDSEEQAVAYNNSIDENSLSFNEQEEHFYKNCEENFLSCGCKGKDKNNILSFLDEQKLFLNESNKNA